MHIAVTGSSGLVGSALVVRLEEHGDRVTRLVRDGATEDDLVWDPTGEAFDAAALDGADGVVHLAGENIAASRWNAAVKDRIRDSRVRGTRMLAEGLARMSRPPAVLVSASAIGFYGDRGDELLDEESSSGHGFLAEVVRDWEAATQGASEAGIRVVHLRFGVVLSRYGGALAKMLTPLRCGIGGRIGSGRQVWSWISIDDAVGSVRHALTTGSLSGPVNGVTPHPVTNAEFTRALGRALRRPTVLTMPSLAARIAFGEMAGDLLLASTRAEPKRLVESGYPFRYPALDEALRHLLLDS